MFKSTLESLVRSAATDTLEANINFQGESGMRPKIVRKASPGACPTCAALAGEWYYGEQPTNVYWRHGKNCNCTVAYDPGDGKTYINLHKSVKWNKSDEAVEWRKEFAQKNTTVSKTRKKLNAADVEINSAKKLSNELTDDEIIAKLKGVDKTEGSCSSLAFAYAGNKAGYDVVDYRGGASCEIFANLNTIKDIANLKGVTSTIVENYDAFEAAKQALKSAKIGKEYYFSIGKHSAIVRRVKGGTEYLELQSSIKNGFIKLTTNELERRFSCTKTYTRAGIKWEQTAVLIDLDSLEKNDEFITLLNYINTAK